MYEILSNRSIGCKTRDEILLACLTGLSSLEDKDAFTLYPNPSFGTIYINGLQHSHLTINLMDLDGRIIRKWNSPDEGLNIEDLLPGIYILNMQVDNSVMNRRIIKN